MAESADEFFSEWFANDETSNLDNSARLVQAYLTGNATAIATASSLYCETHKPDGPEASRLVEILILPIAEELLETQQALVQLLRELLKVPETQPQQSDETRGAWTKGLSLKYDLEERGLRYGDPDPKDVWLRDQLRNDWARINRFASLVYAEGLEDSLWTFGDSTLRLTLRRAGWSVNWSGPETNSDEIEALQGHADAAAYWLLIAANRLYKEQESTRERWGTFMADLEWISEQNLREETKLLCREALAGMRGVQ